jgi:hypothetical protein
MKPVSRPLSDVGRQQPWQVVEGDLGAALGEPGGGPQFPLEEDDVRNNSATPRETDAVRRNTGVSPITAIARANVDACEPWCSG